MKYIKYIGVGIISILILVIVYVYVLNENNPDDLANNPPQTENTENYNIVLFGSPEITLYEGDEYQEIGYYAIRENEIVTNQVKVENNIDSNTPGEYYVSYTIGSVSKRRIVKVVANPNNDVQDITMKLLGNPTVQLYVGDRYIDSGCEAYDKDNNNISSKIITDNKVNTSVAGTYYVTYYIWNNDDWKTLEREVIVNKKNEEVENNLDIGVEYDKSYTNNNVQLTISAAGNKFMYIKLPNGNQIAANITKYTITENGVYYFYAYDSDGNYKKETVRITNIDKTPPTASCVAKVMGGKTDISVNASDNSGIANYIYQGKYTSSNPSYSISEALDSVSVSVKDKAGNTRNIACQVDRSYMEIHFIAGVSDDDAILIRTDDKVIMIDGGRYEARTKIVNYLKDLGIKKIDVMMGSHVHWNHVQAQAAILDNFEVSELYYSVDILNCVSKNQCKSDDVKYIKSKIQSQKKTPKIVKVGDELDIGEMKLYFIGPTRGVFTTYQNANSSVFILQYGDNKLMFTGDTPSNYMNTSKFKANAQKFGITLDIDVLKWPHHGYEDLTSTFFKATTPKYAIIPNCCYCSSKYPSSTNKNLMKTYGVKYYQVCSGKNIVLTSDGKNITIKTNQKASTYKR